MRYMKAMGVAVVACLSLLAFTAVSVQAQTHDEKLHTKQLKLRGDWKKEGQLLSLNATVNGNLPPAELALLDNSLLVPGVNIAIKCDSVKVEEGVILPLSGSPARSIGHGKVKFHDCNAYEHSTLKVLPFCNIYEDATEKEDGLITAAALFHVVRTAANGAAYVLVEPSSGLSGVFADVYFGALCPIEEELIEVKGSLLLETLALEAEVQKVKEVTDHNVKLLFGDQLKFGVHDASLDGEVELFLTGAHAGEKWGIEAGA